MGSRLELNNLLKSILGSDNVYYQPPKNITMKYPAIRYSTDRIQAAHANDKPYKIDTAYQIMVIDANPDSTLPLAIAALPSASWVTGYTRDNLNHYVFKLYY